LDYFAVGNFRSIREGVRLRMTPAAKDHTLPGNLVGDDPNRLLASAVLYGANASGKSNILKALAYLRSMVENSATRLLT
jgi:AAA15 family ATPase/GTPase